VYTCCWRSRDREHSAFRVEISGDEGAGKGICERMHFSPECVFGDGSLDSIDVGNGIVESYSLFKRAYGKNFRVIWSQHRGERPLTGF
jgi:hypothetical protein